ncbi:hypothetical protein [Hymenobacter sp. BRD67]|uniref:hypothetical protein n=1 Tax=Hymenobacter sp. BRD67 TaxID=2675877 RepID=UPI001565D1E8|nr:hypothetical protein [Hymenobacter sp. BRD67]QKG53293.1 hypothetical protein GKZ67_12725 [Hymenobacter sp. BRD67]
MALALLVGPLAKESFVFLLPWLLWFGRRALGWQGQAAALALGLLALAAVHWWVDKAAAAPAAASVSNAFSHVENLWYSLRKVASLKGIAEVFSIWGLFWLPVAAALLRPNGRRALAPLLGWPEAGLALIVLLHMALSGDLGRMGYLFSPVFTAALALAVSWLGRIWGRPGRAA